MVASPSSSIADNEPPSLIVGLSKAERMTLADCRGMSLVISSMCELLGLSLLFGLGDLAIRLDSEGCALRETVGLVSLLAAEAKVPARLLLALDVGIDDLDVLAFLGGLLLGD